MTEPSSAEQVNIWRRRLAAGANNQAWTLAEKPSRTPAEDAGMLHAAHAARHLWDEIGTERNLALADLLLGQVHALLGLAPTAAAYAEQALGYFTAHGGETSVLALAHAVRANAAHAQGVRDLHHQHYARALELAGTIADPETRKIFEASFQLVPKPS